MGRGTGGARAQYIASLLYLWGEEQVGLGLSILLVYCIFGEPLNIKVS